MRQSKTLARLRAGKPARICNLGHFMPAYICHAAHAGFDCVWLDMEHRAMSDREAQALLAFFHLYDIDCLLRASTLEKTRLYRYLEDGATGLMIPHVSTAELAQHLVQSTKFPPLGNRGLDGAGLDSDFLLRGGLDYPEQANRETFLVVQIESPEAVDNAESIAAVPGIDGLFIGPGDLSLRLRTGNHAMTLAEATERVAAAASKHGKAWGQPAPSRDALQQLHQQGAQLLAYGGEFITLKNMLEHCARDFQQVCEEESKSR